MEHEIKSLSDCSFADAVKIWNEGFQGYFVDMTTSLDRYLGRLQRDGVSPEFSLLAYCDGRPAGFLLNGIRKNGRLKVAWNGGTGVSLQFRGQGLGKALMAATLDLYSEQGVDVAMLEAISENQPAIALYEQFGYETVDRLIFLEHKRRLGEHAFGRIKSQSYLAKHVAPYDVGRLEFYHELAPWQAQWQSVTRNSGEALIVCDAYGAAVGYALYQKKYDEQGSTISIALYQCVSLPGVDAEAVISCALQTVYAPPELECERSTYNLGTANEVVQMMLVKAGFTSLIEQVHMVRRFDNVPVNDE